MLHLSHITNRFSNELILNDLRLKIDDGTMYGLAGEDTTGMAAVLRTIMGISRPDLGDVFLDGESVYENESVRQKMFFMPQDLLFRPRQSLQKAAEYFSGYCVNWDWDTFRRIMEVMEFDPNQKLYLCTNEQKQTASLAIAFSARPKVLLLENPFYLLSSSEKDMVQQLMRSYTQDLGTIIFVTSPSIDETKFDRFGYMSEATLFDGVTEAEFNKMKEKTEKEGKAYALEHFFQ